MKARSRGVSREMSAKAISKRFDILVELDEVARSLCRSRRLGKLRDKKMRAEVKPG